MKTPFLRSLGLGSCLALLLPLVTTWADETTPPATGSSGQRQEQMQQLIQQLNLTEAQKEQIKQIRESVTDKQQRRQQIMAVLTPDQKVTLKQWIQQKKASAS